MGKIKSLLIAKSGDKDLDLFVLALLSASSVLRKENELRQILTHLKEINYNGRKIYEALLQTYLFAGYPSALISLSVYSEYFSAERQIAEQWEIKRFKERGEKNCRKIYGNRYEKLIKKINSFSPELSDWLVTEGYGKVFGRKGLTLKEREVCNITVLTALKFESQLYSHINGGHRLGLHPNDIEKIITALSALGKVDCVKFGKKVLRSFVNRKRITEGKIKDKSKKKKVGI
jgi:4-carboxymuconolactone decarboxylase